MASNPNYRKAMLPPKLGLSSRFGGTVAGLGLGDISGGHRWVWTKMVFMLPPWQGNLGPTEQAETDLIDQIQSRHYTASRHVPPSTSSAKPSPSPHTTTQRERGIPAFPPSTMPRIAHLTESILPQPHSFSKKKHYEIMEVLGTGSFGKVMVCRGTRWSASRMS